MDILIKVVLPLALAFIMLSLGLGLTLADFKRVFSQPRGFLAGAISQLVLVPLVGYLCIMLFGLSGALAVGLMILSFCPGGVTSNIMTKFAGGDVALSVSLTAVISLASMITVPFLVTWAVGHFMGAEAPPVTITSLAISMFLITALPVLLGVAFRHFAASTAIRIEPVVSLIATVLFVLIVVAALAGSWQTFIDNLPTLGPALIAMNILLILIGALFARVMGLGMHSIKTVALETGVQNSTVGITLGTIIALQATGFSEYSLPAAVYGITMYLVTLPAILWFRSKNSAVELSGAM